MRARTFGLLCFLGAVAAGCSLVLGIDDYRDCNGSECTDAASDAPVALEASADASADVKDAAPRCDASAPFTSVVALTNLNTSADEFGGFVSADGRRFYFARQSAGNQGYQLYVSAVSDAGSFQPPTIVTDLSADAATNDYAAAESPDGLRLYFYSQRPPSTPGYGGTFISERATIGGPWAPPQLHKDGNATGAGPAYPIPGSLYEPFNFYLYRLPVDGNGNIGLPVSVDDGDSGINVPVDKAVQAVVVTPDELHLYFASFRYASFQLHIWSSNRSTTSAAWGQPVMLPFTVNEDVGDSGVETTDSPVYVTEDNCALYFSSRRVGNFEMYRATRP